MDTALLWQLLIYQHFVPGTGSPQLAANIFGGSLLQREAGHADKSPHAHEGEEAEYDLLGSAGIYGHRTAPTLTPFYPPRERGVPLGRSDYANNSMQVWSTFQGSTFQGFMADSADGQDLALLANEYGRSIETWFDLDIVT